MGLAPAPRPPVGAWLQWPTATAVEFLPHTLTPPEIGWWSRRNDDHPGAQDPGWRPPCFGDHDGHRGSSAAPAASSLDVLVRTTLVHRKTDANANLWRMKKCHPRSRSKNARKRQECWAQSPIGGARRGRARNEGANGRTALSTAPPPCRPASALPPRPPASARTGHHRAAHRPRRLPHHRMARYRLTPGSGIPAPER